MKLSIRIKITFMVVIFSIVTVVSSWAICNYFIEDFFVHNVKKNLVLTYESCNKLFLEREDEIEDEEFGDLFGYIDNPSGATVFIIDQESFQIYSSVKLNMRAAESLRNIMNSYDFSALDQNEKYEIRITDDKNFNERYYDLIGLLDNGNIILLRSPIAQIETSIHFVTKLFVIVSFFLVFIGGLIIMLVSNVFSRPIRNMAQIAKRMTNLDFDARVKVDTKDEIGELGNCMNDLSTKLEQTISGLKLANIQLANDIEEKIQIDEMRKEFLSHVSHELKTPIALIQGYAEGLKDNVNDDPENAEFYLDVIMDEANKMNGLVRMLLDLNELEFGKDNITIERFELTEFLQDIINASSILLEQSGAKLILEAEGPVYVWADEFMMEQVFTNYLTNAIHYVKPDGKIRIWLEQKEQTVRVNVYNEGTPIADKDIDKVFIKFYKADAARTREYGGSGIGLSIVAAAMKAHKKDYGVYNVEDGVVFYFELDTTDTKGDVVELQKT